MALFRITRSVDPAPLLRGPGLYLRPAQSGDYPAWSYLREISREFLTPWEPTWPSDDLTRAAFRRRLRRQAEEIARDESVFVPFCEIGDGGLVQEAAHRPAEIAQRFVIDRTIGKHGRNLF